MHALRPLEPGVMFWAGRDELRQMKALGVRCGQLGIPEAVELTAVTADAWRADTERKQFTLVTVFAAFDGESYEDIPAARRTVGFVPRATREKRERRTLALSDFAAKLGVPGIACHIGFVPDESADPDRVKVREMVGRICDHAAAHDQTFALETGQETPQVLAQFIEEVGRPNLRINFDPANMILYGTGDPITALDTLARYVVSVHCKDGDWPLPGMPGVLGLERPLGHGSVGIERFVGKLREIGFTGPLNVEREAPDAAERLRDIAAAVELLQKL